MLIEEHGNEAEVIRDKNYHQTERVLVAIYCHVHIVLDILRCFA